MQNRFLQLYFDPITTNWYALSEQNTANISILVSKSEVEMKNWTIFHNRNTNKFIISIFNENNQKILADKVIINDDLNSITIIFSIPIKGMINLLFFDSLSGSTPTPTPFVTPTRTPTITISPTITTTPTITATKTLTPTRTPSKTVTNSLTFTRTMTPTRTGTRTITPTNSPSPTPTLTPTATKTLTSTPTLTKTESLTPTPTRTPTKTLTPTRTPSST